jgi:hypothetical protein
MAQLGDTVMRSSGYPRRRGIAPYMHEPGIAVIIVLISNRWLAKSSAEKRRCLGAYWGYPITPAKFRLASLRSLGHHNSKVSEYAL